MYSRPLEFQLCGFLEFRFKGDKRTCHRAVMCGDGSMSDSLRPSDTIDRLSLLSGFLDLWCHLSTTCWKLHLLPHQGRWAIEVWSATLSAYLEQQRGAKRWSAQVIRFVRI
jgi:hypothetical protein